MDVTTSFKIGAAVWDGDKFLIETATDGGNKQIKVTAEVVKAYLGGSGGSGGGLDMRVLPFTGIVEDMEVKQESVAGGAYGLGIYYVMKAVAALRGGKVNEANRSDVNSQLNMACGRLFPQVEAYPDLKAHQAIADAMQQNNYLQREITAARTVYNSRVTQWNTDLFSWPTKMIVAARQGYTTRIPFTASAETREMARSKFF